MSESENSAKENEIDTLIKRVAEGLTDKDLEDTQVSIQIVSKQGVVAHWRMFAVPRDTNVTEAQ